MTRNPENRPLRADGMLLTVADTVRPDGSFDLSPIMRFALARAHTDRAIDLKLGGRVEAFASLMSRHLRDIWEWARGVKATGRYLVPAFQIKDPVVMLARPKLARVAQANSISLQHNSPFGGALAAFLADEA